MEEHTEESPNVASIKCADLLNDWPKDNYHLRLTDYQRGKRYASYDYDRDDNWEIVYVPLFPGHLRELGNNFSSVIVSFDDIHNEAELNERMKEAELDSQLWYTQQELPPAVHSDLAQKYKLMDFSRCVVLQGGFTPPSPLIGKSAVMGSYLGMIASGIVFVWNFLAMLIPARRPREREEERGPVSNRAGLPDF